jgi:hypothetical protein
MAQQMPHNNKIHKLRAPVFEEGGIVSHQLRFEIEGELNYGNSAAAYC